MRDRPVDPGWWRDDAEDGGWCAIEVGGAAAHPRLHLASDRVCPYSPHASLEEVSGAARADQRVVPKARSGSLRHVGVASGGRVGHLLAGGAASHRQLHGIRLTQITHSWRSRAAATAVRAWVSLSGLVWRLVRWV